MSKENQYDSYFMDVALRTAQNSYAHRAKVGAVLVKDDHIVATGWNDRVAGTSNECEELIEPNSFSTKFNIEDYPALYRTRFDVVHAEVNLIYFCAKNGIKTDGTTLYITLSPCVTCALAIIQAGIRKVYYHKQYHDTTGLDVLKEANIEIKEL